MSRRHLINSSDVFFIKGFTVVDKDADQVGDRDADQVGDRDADQVGGGG